MKVEKVSNVEYVIPQDSGMLVPGRVFASEKLFSGIEKDRCLDQVKAVASLPGIVDASFVMPDAHQGYGFPIGGVAAFDKGKGVVSPSGVGYDINCGVRLLKTSLKKSDLNGKEKELLDALFSAVPTGVNSGGELGLSMSDLDELLVDGASWAVKNGFGVEGDVVFCEEGGCFSGADPSKVSLRAKQRGLPQLCSLGAGNHFFEVLVVSELFDDAKVEAFGLSSDQVVLMIHTGSRGLGHQVASDYIKLFLDEFPVAGDDQSLVFAPLSSSLASDYLSAMACAANFAFVNRQLLTHRVRRVFEKFFSGVSVDLLYDVCHNIAKWEFHDGREVLVLRKGATRSFGPGSDVVPKDYSSVGQPVIIPGSMGSSSFVLSGLGSSLGFSSCPHGAGRVSSRTKLRRELSFSDAKARMDELGVLVKSRSHKGLVEESPLAYKDSREVVDTAVTLGFGLLVARLDPLLVVIG